MWWYLVHLGREIKAAVIGCPRERRGYRCHADHPDGCEMCGRRRPVRADLAAAREWRDTRPGR